MRDLPGHPNRADLDAMSTRDVPRLFSLDPRAAEHVRVPDVPSARSSLGASRASQRRDSHQSDALEVHTEGVSRRGKE